MTPEDARPDLPDTLLFTADGADAARAFDRLAPDVVAAPPLAVETLPTETADRARHVPLTPGGDGAAAVVTDELVEAVEEPGADVWLSLDPIVAAADAATAFRLVHVLAERVPATGGRLACTLSGDRFDDATVETFATLFDARDPPLARRSG